MQEEESVLPSGEMPRAAHVVLFSFFPVWSGVLLDVLIGLVSSAVYIIRFEQLHDDVFRYMHRVFEKHMELK